MFTCPSAIDDPTTGVSLTSYLGPADGAAPSTGDNNKYASASYAGEENAVQTGTGNSVSTHYILNAAAASSFNYMNKATYAAVADLCRGEPCLARKSQPGDAGVASTICYAITSDR